MYFEEIAEIKGHVTLVCEATGKAASLYDQWCRTLHSLVGFGVDYISESDGQFSTASTSGTRSNRASHLCNTALIIVDEDSMINRKLLDLEDVILKDQNRNCSRVEDNKPRYGGVSIALHRDYLQMLLVLQSKKWVKNCDCEGWYVLLCSWDELPCASLFWEHVELPKVSKQVRQSKNRRIPELIHSVFTGSFSNGRIFPFQAGPEFIDANNCIWKLYTTTNHQKGDLKILTFCPTNAVADSHNDGGLSTFRGDSKALFSVTKMKQLASSEKCRRIPLNKYVVPEMTHCSYTIGMVQHRLVL